jgi:electron transport complex protein RnfB
MARDELVEAIDRLLPQTQCRRCGYPSCLPYAAAVADGEAINRCPPGGGHTIDALAALLDRPPIPLDPQLAPMAPDAVALIDESRCIGCALCLPVCPVDAIVGAPAQMHTVIARHCTGCELCIPACPVDCIEMTVAADEAARTSVPPDLIAARASAARLRFERHTLRLAARASASQARRQQRRASAGTPRTWDEP